MTTTLVSIHGFAQSGAELARGLEPVRTRCGDALTWRFPDAPLTCSAGSVEGLRARLGSKLWPAPYLTWWDATEDGREYRGWPGSLALLRRELAQDVEVGVLGFSQGAMVAAVLAALSARGELPPLRFVVLIAGRLPRATELVELFHEPIGIPSLHVWSERDPLAEGAALAGRFAPELRATQTWDGGHRLPSDGAAAEAVVIFLRAHGGAPR